MVCPSRRVASRPSSRILARCCESADWLKPTAEVSAETDISPSSASRHRMSNRFSLASSFKSPAASAALRSSRPSPAVLLGTGTGEGFFRLGVTNLVIANIYVKCRHGATVNQSEGMTAKPESKGFFDEPTNAVSYRSGMARRRRRPSSIPCSTSIRKAGRRMSTLPILQAADALDLKIVRVLETHAHADHLSAAPYITQKTRAAVCIGEHIK